MNPTSRQALKQLLRQHSLRIAEPGKEFKLASGGTTRVFCDVKKTLLQPEGAQAAAQLLLECIKAYEDGFSYDRYSDDERPVDAVAGVVLGGCPIASAVSNFGFMAGQRYPVLYVRKEAKDHGTEVLVEGETRPHMSVVLLEDVATTGGSAIKVLKAAGVSVPAVFAIVDRSEGQAKEALAEAEVGADFEALFTLDDLT